MRRHLSLCCCVLILALPQCGPSYQRVTNLDSSANAIVCFGDSITRGYGASPGNTYPEVMGRLLGRPVINAGRDGDTTESGLARLDRDVLAHQPRLVIVGLGGNDFLRKVPANTTYSNLERIVERIHASGAMVVVVHGKFGVFGDPYLDDMKTIATTHGALLVRDALKDILGRPARMHDQIHPNDLGYALLAERVAAVVGPLLEAADRARAEVEGT
jgi:acyl-CoA thioesterase I